MTPKTPTKPPASNDAPKVVRSGPITFKRAGGILSGSWTDKELVLTDATLFVKPTPSPSSKRKHIPIALPAITALERVEQAPACLLLSVAKLPSPKPSRQYLLSFRTDSELYDWQDEIYARAPRLGGWSTGPFDFVHEAHVGFDSNLDQLPAQYTEMLGMKTRAAGNAGATSDPVKVAPAASTSKPKPQEDDDDEAALVLEGRASVKHQGAFSWFWKERWLVLAGGVLSIKRSKTSTATNILPLPQLRSLTRLVVSPRRPHCLLLELRDGRRVYLNFNTDKELYAWNDAMYLCVGSECVTGTGAKPKSADSVTKVQPPKEGGVHHVRVGVDKDGEFTSHRLSGKLDPASVHKGVRRSLRSSTHSDTPQLKSQKDDRERENGVYPSWSEMSIPRRPRVSSDSDTAVVV